MADALPRPDAVPPWEADVRIEVRDLGGEVIEANAAGLTDGSHLHLEDSNGLEDGSVGLVLERSDEELERRPVARGAATAGAVCGPSEGAQG